MFSISAINETDTSRSRVEALAPTKEAQESHLTKLYQDALLNLQTGDLAKARSLFHAIIHDPLSIKAQKEATAKTDAMLHLRFLTFRNLAETYVKQGSEFYKDALHCYIQAVTIDEKDVVIWNRLGTLACSLGLLNIARKAFEHGLHCSPRHWSCMEKLVEVLIAIGDENGCLAVVKRLLKISPSHPRALYIRSLIEEHLSPRTCDGIDVAAMGIDTVEPQHKNLSFVRKRKLDDPQEISKPKKRKQHSVQLILPEPSWLAVVKAILDAFQNRDQGRALKSEELKDRSSYLANSRVIFLLQSSHLGADEETLEGSVQVVKLADPSCLRGPCLNIDVTGTEDVSSDAVHQSDKVSSCKLSESEEHHAHERRSTRLERLRSRKLEKGEEMVADCPKSLRQSLECFISDKCHVQPEVKETSGTQTITRADCQRIGRCLIYSSSNNGVRDVSFSETENSFSVEAKEVKQFLKDYVSNSGLYHVGQAVLERVSDSALKYDSSLHILLDLEKSTRQWGKGRSCYCNLFLAELYVDMAASTTETNKVAQYLSQCNYNICKVVECTTLEISAVQMDNATLRYQKVDNEEADVPEDRQGEQSLLESSIVKKTGWSFWARFHWLNARYCVLSGNLLKEFNEFKKCLSILQAQEVHNVVILPHCKVDNKISMEMVEQKLYEFEMGDLLKTSAVKMHEQGRHSDLMEILESTLFSGRGSNRNVRVSGKCNEVIQSHEFTALNMLISACRHVRPVNLITEMKCHLRKLEILCHCTGMLFPKAEDEILLSPASGGSPSSVELDDDRIKESRAWNKVLAEEVKLISKCVAAFKETTDALGPINSQGALSVESSLLGRIQHVLLTILVHFGSGLPSKRHSNLSLHDQLESSYFVDTAVAFCRIQQLYSAVPMEEQVALLVTVHEMLAERGICSAGVSCEDGEGSFLKMAIKHLLALEIKLKQHFVTKGSVLGDSESEQADIQENSNALRNGLENIKVPGRSDSFTDLSCSIEKRTGETEELEKKRIELGLDSALDQCFFCLYGLNLKADLESGSSDGLAVHKTTNCGDFQTKEQCAAVLQYVLPYAKACSKAGLAKLRKVLQAVRKQFPQPPSHILAGNAIDTFMDDSEFDEARFSEMVLSKSNIDEICSFAFPKQEQEPATAMVIYSTSASDSNPKGVETSTAEPYLEVYQHLYYLLTQVEDTSASDKWPGFVLTKEGEDFIEQNASLYKYDLLYNLMRFESWQKIASIYDEEVDLLLNDGSKNVNVLDWRKNARLTSRVENSRRRSRRCLLMSLALANTQAQQFQVHELLALVYYDTLQNAVPSYDQRQLVQKKDTLWVSRCLNAFRHFEEAYSQRPDWTHLLYLGKLCEKLGKPPEEAFFFYKKAIEMNPSAVDPLYRLHRSRLKLLCKGRYHDLQIIQVVAKYCYQNSTEEHVNSKLSFLNQQVDINTQPDESCKQLDNDGAANESRQTDIAAAWKLLFKDCISAMQACVDGELKHFHKARFCIAQGLYYRAEEQDWERAKEELAFCFRSSRSLFTINMWELDGVVKKNRRKAAAGTSGKRILELGLPESSRKFITCVRKYLLLYIVLCEKAGDIVTLERAYSTLRSDKRFSICLEDMTNVALTAYVHALGAAISHAEKSGCASNSSLQGLLERMFNLFMDHGTSWPDASETGVKDGSEVADKAVYCYIHRYLHYLENDCRVDALELVNERIRKRFKNPKLANPHFSQICRHATLAWCRALCSALSSVTPLEKPHDQSSQLIVDLQYEVLLCSPYDADIMNKISQVSIAGTLDDTGSVIPPASAAYIARIKAVPIVQVSTENADKAQSLLRATFVFYREVTSGPFPSGINLFMASPSGAASESTGNVPVIPGYEPLDLSTPRKLLLWAFALVHGRAASIADVVKYCEEQAKTRLKKWPTHSQPVSTSTAGQDKFASCSSRVEGREQAAETDATQTLSAALN